MTSTAPIDAAWHPLAGSEQAVALEVLRFGPIARVDLARRMGLSNASLTRLTKPLLDSGLLVAGQAQPVPLGRPTLPLDVQVNSTEFIGVKIVADAAYFVVTDLRGNMSTQTEISLDNAEPAHVIALLAAHIRELRITHPAIGAIGVSLGARVMGRQHVVAARYLNWVDVPLAALLEAATGLDVVVENDIRALTQAEAWFGVGRGLESFAVLTVGAGVGCGVVVGDELLPPASGNVTHVILDATAPEVCSQGHRGCGEALLIADALLSQARTAAGEPHLTYDEMLARALEFAQVLERAAYNLGVLVATVANLIAPQKVVLMGEGVGFAGIFDQALRRGARYARTEGQVDIDIEIPPFEFFEWARGAAVVAVQSFVLGQFGRSTETVSAG